MNADQLNKLGEIADSIENVFFATNLPLPAQFRLNQIKDKMADWINEIRELVSEIEAG